MAEDKFQNSGVFPDTDIAHLIHENAIKASYNFDKDQIQPASLDLRLGKKAWRLRASFLPGAGKTVSDKLEQVKLHEIDLQQGAVLETGCVYLVRLCENLALPENISAVTNPKSSTGRLDIFTRVITDRAREFDTVGESYHGPLYLEISPRSFPILVRQGSRLSQMRFRHGARILDNTALHKLQQTAQLVADDAPNISNNGLALSVDLDGRSFTNSQNDKSEIGQIIGYRGKRVTPVIDVDKPSTCAIEDFWEPIYNRGKRQLILDPDEFYILASREAVHVPPLYAAEMTPFDPLVGEFRVHYAGFFDPGFGDSQAGGAGARAVLEVRSHEVPFILEHGQIIGRLVYEHMIKAPHKLYGSSSKSNYQAQGLKLSKHFKT